MLAADQCSTYPTTYAELNNFSGKATADWKPDSTEACQPTKDITPVTLPATANGASLIFPFNTASHKGPAAVPTQILNYLGSLDEVAEQFKHIPLTSCSPATKIAQPTLCTSSSVDTVTECETSTVTISNFNGTSESTKESCSEKETTLVQTRTFTLAESTSITGETLIRKTAGSLTTVTGNAVFSPAPAKNTPVATPEGGTPSTGGNDDNTNSGSSPVAVPAQNGDASNDQQGQSSSGSSSGSSSNQDQSSGSSGSSSNSGSDSSGQQSGSSSSNQGSSGSDSSGDQSGSSSSNQGSSGSDSSGNQSGSSSSNQGSSGSDSSGQQSGTSSSSNQGSSGQQDQGSSSLGSNSGSSNDNSGNQGQQNGGGSSSSGSNSQQSGSQGSDDSGGDGSTDSDSSDSGISNLVSAVQQAASQARASSQAGATAGGNAASNQGDGSQGNESGDSSGSQAGGAAGGQNSGGNQDDSTGSESGSQPGSGTGAGPDSDSANSAAAPPVFTFEGQTLTAGGAATFGGETVSALPDQNRVVIGGQTISLADGQATTIAQAGGKPIVASRSGSEFVVDGQTLSPGQQITAGQSTASLAESTGVLFVDGKPTTLAGPSITLGGSVINAVETSPSSGGLGGYIYSGMGGSATGNVGGSAGETGGPAPFTGVGSRVEFMGLSFWAAVLVGAWVM